MLVSLNIVLAGTWLLLANTRGAQSFTSNPTQVAANSHGMRPGQTFTVNGHVIAMSQSHEHDDISMEVIGRVANPQNVQSQTTPGQQRPSVRPSQQGVLFSRDSIERHDVSLEDVIGRLPNRPLIQTQGAHQRPAIVPAGQGVRFFDDSIERHDLSLEDVITRNANGQLVRTQTRPAVPSVPQGGRVFRDSDEHPDLSLEDLVGRVSNRQHLQNRQPATQPGVHHFDDSDEHDDESYEVDFSLLPELLRLIKPAVQKQVPAAPSQGHLPGQQQVNQRYDERHEVSLEFNDILANPTFQERIQEIDDRLKRTPGARGKRLMEKYATALAVYSSPSNAASTSMNSSYYLSFFIASCFWAWFL